MSTLPFSPPNSDISLASVATLTFGLPKDIVELALNWKRLLEIEDLTHLCPRCNKRTTYWSHCGLGCGRRYLFCSDCTAKGKLPPPGGYSAFYECTGCKRGVCRPCFRGSRSGCGTPSTTIEGIHYYTNCDQMQKCNACAGGFTRCGRCDRDACSAHANYCNFDGCSSRICDFHNGPDIFCRSHVVEAEARAQQTGCKRTRAQRDEMWKLR